MYALVWKLKLRVSSVCWICYCFHSQIVNSFFAKFQATTKSDVWGKVARIALWLWIPAVSIKHVYRFGWPLNVSFRLRLIRNIHLMKRKKWISCTQWLGDCSAHAHRTKRNHSLQPLFPFFTKRDQGRTLFVNLYFVRFVEACWIKISSIDFLNRSKRPTVSNWLSTRKYACLFDHLFGHTNQQKAQAWKRMKKSFRVNV